MTEIDDSLIGKEIRVIFEDPGAPIEFRSKVWKGRLTNITDRFVELTNDGHKSYISKDWIVALMEFTGHRKEPEEL